MFLLFHLQEKSTGSWGLREKSEGETGGLGKEKEFYVELCVAWCWQFTFLQKYKTFGTEETKPTLLAFTFAHSGSS